jgi:hypothetical protein
MKPIGLTLVVGALIMVATAGAGGAGGSATGGSQLTVHDVFGLQMLELQSFGFNARLRGDGSADGWFTYRELDDGSPYTADGPVTCLTVIGSDAWIGGTIEHSNDPGSVGMGAWWHVTDDGEGASGAPDITTFLGVGTQERTQLFCSSHPPYLHPFPIDHGDIQVRI